MAWSQKALIQDCMDTRSKKKLYSPKIKFGPIEDDTMSEIIRKTQSQHVAKISHAMLIYGQEGGSGHQ